MSVANNGFHCWTALFRGEICLKNEMDVNADQCSSFTTLKYCAFNRLEGIVEWMSYFRFLIGVLVMNLIMCDYKIYALSCMLKHF